MFSKGLRHHYLKRPVCQPPPPPKHRYYPPVVEDEESEGHHHGQEKVGDVLVVQDVVLKGEKTNSVHNSVKSPFSMWPLPI